jgi:MbtH protein
MDGYSQYKVLVNHEGQHSIWPSSLPVPNGWTALEFEGRREDCEALVDKVWTNIKPRSAVSSSAD